MGNELNEDLTISKSKFGGVCTVNDYVTKHNIIEISSYNQSEFI